MGRVCESVLEVIGRTPVVALRRFVGLTSGLEGTILLKLEYLNPGSSKKDRIALEMVRRAQREGRLRPGQTVVELTSGNTGTGLAIVCAVLGHPFVAVMSEGNSIERRRQMAALGAEVKLVPQTTGEVAGQVSGADIEAVDRVARQIVVERGAFRADQFELPGSAGAHEAGTGPELWDQAEGKIDAFVDFVGSGGSFTGVARALKARNRDIRCYIVEPERAAYLARGNAQRQRSGAATESAEDGRHKIQGGGYSRDLPLLDLSLCDGFLTVSDDEAIETARRLARTEGVFAGFSTGANVAAAGHLLSGELRGKTIACLACDSGLKYLSTDLWE